MDAVTTSYSTSPPSKPEDAVDASSHRGCDDPLQSPGRTPIAVVARRRIEKAGVIGSPVRRSPRLSGLPPPQPPMECRDTQDPDESSDDESGSINDVALYLSREETPENDALPPDEPSTVLANRIMRAHDNPSPPPRDLAHPSINYVPGKDSQFPLPGVFAPPSPFRPINLLERLNQASDSPFNPSRRLRAQTSGDRPDMSDSGIIPPRGFISPESCSPFVTSMLVKTVPYEDLASADTIASSPIQCAVDDHPSRATQHLITLTSSSDSEGLSSNPAQGVDSSSSPVVPSASDGHPRGPLPRSGQQSYHIASPIVKALSPAPSNENDMASSATETITPGGQDQDGQEFLYTDNNNPSALEEEQGGKCKATSTDDISTNSQQRLHSLSPFSTNLLTGLCLSSAPTSSIEQTVLPADPIRIKHPPATPPRTPRVPPDFSTVQRPVVAPTPMRASNGVWKFNSPSKFEINNIYRTPAQRVPIETALSRGTPSFQRTGQLSAGSDQSLPGRIPTRAPVFTRPALDDPSRSPAKRVLVTDLVGSPKRGTQASSSPARLNPRARSVEPRPPRPILARSRSVEPCAGISKPSNQGRIKESIFPMVPLLQRPGTKLPFPLVTGQKSGSDLPPPIPEEHEAVEIGNTETDATLRKVTQGNTTSQLRQPSTNSRIPRIGNKPYAKPSPKNGKTIAGTVTANPVGAPRPSTFQLTCKNNGVGNSDMELSSTQSTNDQRLVGSLKRKRGADVAVHSNSHPVMIRQVVPGILRGKYAPKPAKLPSQVQAPSDSSPPKVTQSLKFRKVVDGMLSSRYAPSKTNLAQAELSDSTSRPLSPLSELSSSSNEEGPLDEKFPPTAHPQTSDTSRTDGDASVMEPNAHKDSLHQDASGEEPSMRPRRTSRTRKPARQQYVLDVFNSNTSARPPPARRKPSSRTEGDGFMGMSATALKALTTVNTTKNQQTVAVLAMEVIRKEGLRPESPTVKARTILQKQRDERDMRRRERAQRRAQMNEEGLGASDAERQAEPGDRVSLGGPVDHDENNYAIPQKDRRGPGDEEDYETPERPERIIEPLRFEGFDNKVKSMKQVKWYRGLSTAVYLDEVDPRPKSLPKDVVVRGCLASTSKNLPLDSLGNLVDIDNRPLPGLVTEQIVVKRYLYDDDIEPEPMPARTTRSKSKKSKS